MVRPRFIASLLTFLHGKDGQFAIMTAIMTPVALALAAVAVDTGSLYLEKRKAQGLADIAAITAAANITKAGEATKLVLADNGLTAAAVGIRPANGTISWLPHPDITNARETAIVTRGRYTPSPAIDPANRFTPTSGAGYSDAARVVLRTTGTRHFGGLFIPPPEIVVKATAATTVQAAFSIGSRLVELDGGIVNELLRGLTGSNISLSVMDYNALLGADISLLSFLDILATDIKLTAASYDQLLNSKVTIAQVGRALAAVEGLSSASVAAIKKLAQQSSGPNAQTFLLSRLVGLEKDTLRAKIQSVGAEVGVMELLMMSAILAGQGKQVGLDLNGSVPGLLSLSVDLAIGEPPQHSSWFTIGSGGEVVRTAQTRLRLIAEIGNHSLLAGLLGARIRLPLYLELAYAEAKLKSVSCPTGRRESVQVKIDARPGIANLYLAEVDPKKIVNFANPAPRSPAKLINLTVVSVTGQAHAEIGAIAYKEVGFNASEINQKLVKQVSTNTITTSLVKSLFSSLQLDVRIDLLLGLPILSLPSNTLTLLGEVIGAATPALDGIINELLKTLGLSLGQADIRVHNATCGAAMLVQ